MKPVVYGKPIIFGVVIEEGFVIENIPPGSEWRLLQSPEEFATVEVCRGSGNTERYYVEGTNKKGVYRLGFKVEKTNHGGSVEHLLFKLWSMPFYTAKILLWPVRVVLRTVVDDWKAYRARQDANQ